MLSVAADIVRYRTTVFTNKLQADQCLPAQRFSAGTELLRCGVRNKLFLQ
jgi:hypothetical protein